MVSQTARVRGRSVTALLLGVLVALVAALPFVFSATAQDATPEAEQAPSALADLGLQEIVVTATAETYSLSFAPPLVEGWTLITLVNESEAPANVNRSRAGRPVGG
jgi:hypothetical protein